MLAYELQLVQETKLYLCMVLEVAAQTARKRGDKVQAAAFIAAKNRFVDMKPEQIASFIESKMHKDVKKLLEGRNLLP